MAGRCKDSGSAASKLLVGVLLVAALLIAADRIGLAVATRAAGDTVQRSQHLPSRPDVSIAGFPFLTQFASGHYDQVTLTARDVPVDQHKDVLTLTTVRAVLRDVDVSRSFTSVRAGSETATAQVDYAELSRRLGVRVRYAGGGRIVGTVSLSVLGQHLSATATTRPTLTGETVVFAHTSAEATGPLGTHLSTGSLGQVFALRLPLDHVPFGVRARSLSVDAHGLTLTLDARRVDYSR